MHHIFFEAEFYLKEVIICYQHSKNFCLLGLVPFSMLIFITYQITTFCAASNFKRKHGFEIGSTEINRKDDFEVSYLRTV